MMLKKSNGLLGDGGSGRPASFAPLASSSGPSGASERASYHSSGAASSNNSSTQVRQCDNCQYRVPINECQQFKCKDCGTYIVGNSCCLTVSIDL